MTIWQAIPPSKAAPQWLSDLFAARTHYEELLGWPVTVDIEPRRLAVAVGQELDAVTMPATLGQSVLAELQVTMLAGPVLADPGGAWWTFVTAPVLASRPTVPSELHVNKVRLTPRGAQVIIPGLIDSDASPRWVVPPQPRYSLPPWSVVIGTTQRVVNHLAAADGR